MQSLTHSHHFHLPKMRFHAQPLRLSPIYAENDELIQAIDTQAERNDDLWQLEATPDVDNLQQFWSNVSVED